MHSMTAINVPFQQVCASVKSAWQKRLAHCLGGAFSALLCNAAVAHHDVPHMRQQELRSTVRQQMATPQLARQSAPQPAKPAAAQAAAQASQAGIQAATDANARHLSAQERVELRRQLARDLQAQRSTELGNR